MTNLRDHLTRRGFLKTSAHCASAGAAAGCSTYLAGAAPLLNASAWKRWMQPGGGRRVVAQTPFARIEEVGEGMFAIISTPLDGDYTTVCNGGIVAGSSGTLAVESFATPEGGRWAAEQARALTGRWPDQLVVSHYHGDHSMGVPGFANPEAGGGDGSAPPLRATASTRDLMGDSPNADEIVLARWADAAVVPETEPVEIDLGDRAVTVTPRRGHTSSDLTLEVDGGEGPVWCGDLFLEHHVPQLHGRVAVAAVARGAGAGRPARFGLRSRAWTARRRGGDGALHRPDRLGGGGRREAWRRGISADEAAESYRIPDELGEWISFSPNYHQRAIQAWMDELGGGRLS